MSADPIDISSILTDQGAILAPETLASMLLWSAETSFARQTGSKDPIGFVDLSMRLYAGSITKLDTHAAANYLIALSGRCNPVLSVKVREVADALRVDALKTLREKLDLAVRLTRRQC